MSNQAAAKKKPNLTSVTAAPPPPVVAEMDTTTPLHQPISRFTNGDFLKWNAWLLYRMSEHWTHLTAFMFSSVLNQVVNDNGVLFIRAKKAILLARLQHEDFDPRPVVDIVFCFKFHPEDEQEDKDVRLLVRRVEEWSASNGARFVTVRHPERFDNSWSKVRGLLNGEEGKFMLKDLDK